MGPIVGVVETSNAWCPLGCYAYLANLMLRVCLGVPGRLMGLGVNHPLVCVVH